MKCAPVGVKRYISPVGTYLLSNSVVSWVGHMRVLFLCTLGFDSQRTAKRETRDLSLLGPSPVSAEGELSRDVTAVLSIVSRRKIRHLEIS